MASVVLPILSLGGLEDLPCVALYPRDSVVVLDMTLPWGMRCDPRRLSCQQKRPTMSNYTVYKTGKTQLDRLIQRQYPERTIAPLYYAVALDLKYAPFAHHVEMRPRSTALFLKGALARTSRWGNGSDTQRRWRRAERGDQDACLFPQDTGIALHFVADHMDVVTQMVCAAGHGRTPAPPFSGIPLTTPPHAGSTTSFPRGWTSAGPSRTPPGRPPN